MKNRFSIYHFLIAVLIVSMFSPITSVFAGRSDSHTGSLTIYKLEQELGTERGDGDGNKLEPQPEGKGLEGVKFKFTQTHAYDPVNDKWTEISGTQFHETTDSAGKVVLDNINLGRYVVQEAEAPKHVDLNAEPFTVDIPMSSKDGTQLNYDVYVYPKNDTIRGGAT